MTRPAIEEKKDFQINRFFSKRLTRLLLKTPLTPNQVTFLSLSFGILSGVLFSSGNYGLSIAAAFAYIAACVLDNCDGEIARAKNLKSVFGGWLDIVVDFLADLSLFTGLALGVLKRGVEGPAVFFLILCLAGSFINLCIVILEKLKGFGPAVFNKPNPDGVKRQNIFFKISEALREGDSSWFVVLFAVFGKPEYLLWAGGIYMQIIWISAIALNYRWLFSARKNVAD